MPTKAMILLIDGARAEYLTPAYAPNLNRLAATPNSFAKLVTGQMPSVTNVNHASILTGTTPAINGINGNVFFDPATQTETFIESPQYLKVPTIFTKLAQQHLDSALLTVKGKIDQVFGTDATYRINAEAADSTLLTAIGASLPPEINSIASGQWVVKTAKQLIATKSPAFVYATTNDYVMHHYAPDQPEAQAFIRGIDEQLAAIHALEPARTIYVVADHGMQAKPTLLNLERLLATHDLTTHVVLPLADRYLKNHAYQESGTAYIYVPQAADLTTVKKVLQQTAGVEQVLTRQEAVTQYQLDAQRIGDLVVLGTSDTAFGLTPTPRLTNYPGRSHGSLHELTVPLFCITPTAMDATTFTRSRDIFSHLLTQFCG